MIQAPPSCTPEHHPGLWIRLTYAACLLGAAWNHAAILVRHGLSWNYGGAPWLSCVFWTALTVIDPLAAMALLLRPRIGLALTLAIISCDVAHNGWLAGRAITNTQTHLSIAWLPLLEQIAFLVFVAATMCIAWNDAASRPASRQPDSDPPSAGVPRS